MLQTDPHKNCDLHYACAQLEHARLVVIAAHGRYGAAGDILKLSKDIDISDVAWIAPQATNGSWWGESFLAPLKKNEPGLTSALQRISIITSDLHKLGFGPDRIVLAGFSQGACLMLEHAARNPKPWRGIVAMSGGLLGTSEYGITARDELYGYSEKKFEYEGNLADVQIHIGCHEEDPVIPMARVERTQEIFSGMGAQVTLKTAPGKMHGVLAEDLSALKTMLM